MNFKEEQELRSSIRSLIRYVKTKRLNEERNSLIDTEKKYYDLENQAQLDLICCLLENMDFKYLEAINKKYQKLMQESTGSINVTAVTVNQLNESTERSKVVSGSFATLESSVRVVSSSKLSRAVGW